MLAVVSVEIFIIHFTYYFNLFFGGVGRAGIPKDSSRPLLWQGRKWQKWPPCLSMLSYKLLWIKQQSGASLTPVTQSGILCLWFPWFKEATQAQSTGHTAVNCYYWSRHTQTCHKQSARCLNDQRIGVNDRHRHDGDALPVLKSCTSVSWSDSIEYQ